MNTDPDSSDHYAQTFEQFIDKQRKENPNYYQAAGNHQFWCRCSDCIIFLVGGLKTAHDPEDEMSPEVKDLLETTLGQRKYSEAVQLTHKLARRLL